MILSFLGRVTAQRVSDFSEAFMAALLGAGGGICGGLSGLLVPLSVEQSRLSCRIPKAQIVRGPALEEIGTPNNGETEDFIEVEGHQVGNSGHLMGWQLIGPFMGELSREAPPWGRRNL